MKKILGLMLVIVMITATFASCGNNWVAEVNGEKISIEEFECYMFFAKNTIISSGGEDTEEYWNTFEIEGKKAGDVVKETALKNAIEYTLKAQYAENNGIKRDEKRIEEERQNYIELAFDGSEEDYLTRIGELGLTDEAFTNVLVKDNLSAQYFNNATVETPTSDEIAEYFNNNYFRAKHILIDFSNYATDYSDGRAEAISKVNEVIEAIDSGEDFDLLIEKYNEDPEMLNNDLGYIFTFGEMPKNFEDAVADLEINEISSAVETDYGYHIIKRLECKSLFDTFISLPSAMYEGADGIDEIVNLLIASKREKMLSDLKENSNIKINQKVIDEIELVKKEDE